MISFFHIETKQDPEGLLSTEIFCVPCFLFVKEQTPASMNFLESERAGSNSFQSEKGGHAKTRKKQSRNNSAALGLGLGSPSQDAHNSIFEFFCRTETPKV